MNPDNISFGTWGISGAFGPKTDKEILEVFEYAIEHGITSFDTAHVYGGGRAERLLGEISSGDLSISTKIPAMKKPDLLLSDPGRIEEYYTVEHIQTTLRESLRRLAGKPIETLYLHNWHPAWNHEVPYIQQILQQIQAEEGFKKTGVSLPNDMNAPFPRNFDVVQVPVNKVERWAVEEIGKTTSQVRARSVLAHGALVNPEKEYFEDDERKKKVNGALLEKINHVSSHNSVVEQNEGERLQYALDYVNSIPGIQSIIIGIRTQQHIDRLLQMHG